MKKRLLIIFSIFLLFSILTNTAKAALIIEKDGIWHDDSTKINPSLGYYYNNPDAIFYMKDAAGQYQQYTYDNVPDDLLKQNGLYRQAGGIWKVPDYQKPNLGDIDFSGIDFSKISPVLTKLKLNMNDNQYSGTFEVESIVHDEISYDEDGTPYGQIYVTCSCGKRAKYKVYFEGWHFENPKPSDDTYLGNFKIEKLVPSEIEKIEGGVSKGKVKVTCSCGEEYIYDLYFVPDPIEEEKYGLTLIVDGEGTVRLDNSGYDTTQSKESTIDTISRIYAKAAKDWHFVGWYLDSVDSEPQYSSKSNTYVKQLGYNMKLIAKFEPDDDDFEGKLNLIAIGPGKVKLDNSGYSMTQSKKITKLDEISRIYAKPDEGARFDGWYLSNELDNPYSIRLEDVVMPSGYDMTLIAKFTSIPGKTYDITVYSDGNGLAGINSRKTTKDNQKLTMTVSSGTTVDLTSYPNADFVIDYWAKIVNGEEVKVEEKDFALKVTEDCEYIVHFKGAPGPEYYKLILKHKGDGSTRGGTNYAIPKQSYQIWACPNGDSKFIRWEKEDGTPTEYAQNDFVTMPDEDLTLVAIFEKDGGESHNITVYSDGNGLAGINSSKTTRNNQKLTMTVPSGTTVQLKSYPNADFVIDYWAKIVNGEEVKVKTQDFALKVTEDCEFIVHFKGAPGPEYHKLILKHKGDGSTRGGTNYAIPEQPYPIWACPNGDSKFIRWEKEDGTPTEYAQNDFVTMPDEDLTLVAIFEKDDKLCNVTVYSDGNGLAGINSSKTTKDNQKLTVTVSSGTTVQLKSYPNKNFTIDYWAKIVNGEEVKDKDKDFKYKVTEDCAFIVHFKGAPGPEYYKLVLKHEGDGSTIGGTPYAIPGQPYPIWACPNGDSEFIRWEKEVGTSRTNTGYAQEDSVTMPDEDLTLVAIFKDNFDKGKLNLVAVGPGKVKLDNSGYSTQQSKEAKIDTISRIDAKADDGAHFVGWYLNSLDNEYSLNPDTVVRQSGDHYNMTLYALFSEDDIEETYSLIVKSAGHGKVSGTRKNAIPGQKYRISAIPDEGYRFDYWEKQTADGLSSKTNLPRNANFEMERGNIILIAHFAEGEAEYDLVIETKPGGTATGGGKYPEGENVPLEAKPKTGYKFTGWYYKDGKLISKDPKYTFIMPAGDVTIVADFDTSAEEIESFVIMSVRDVRWKDYFVSSGAETHKYIKIPSVIGSTGVLLRKAKLIADSRSGINRDVAYGYAVETRLRTEGIPIDDSQLRVTYELYDEKGKPIELKSKDKEKYLTLKFDKKGNESYMASVEKIEGNKYETLDWTWVFYLPMDVMDKYNDLLYEQYKDITVKYNIEILNKAGKVVYNYIQAKNTTGETDWGGNVFTYRTDKTVMTDIYNNATN